MLYCSNLAREAGVETHHVAVLEYVRHMLRYRLMHQRPAHLQDADTMGADYACFEN